MAEKNEKIEVDMAVLQKMQEQMAEYDRKMADLEAKNAGLEELFAAKAGTEGETSLREKKSFEPKFRTVRLRKFPVAGDETNMKFVVGWTNKGAYQEVDRTGPVAQYVDFIDIIFLGEEKTKEGKLKAEKVKLLDYMNKGEQVYCKVLETNRKEIKVPTNEEIDVTVFDPQHGLVSTGDKVDGYTAISDIKYKLEVPGISEPVEIDGLFVNA